MKRRCLSPFVSPYPATFAPLSHSRVLLSTSQPRPLTQHFCSTASNSGGGDNPNISEEIKTAVPPEDLEECLPTPAVRGTVMSLYPNRVVNILSTKKQRDLSNSVWQLNTTAYIFPKTVRRVLRDYKTRELLFSKKETEKLEETKTKTEPPQVKNSNAEEGNAVLVKTAEEETPVATTRES